jgi:DNA-directed RNA polymerase specialized sigma24 family protein
MSATDMMEPAIDESGHWLNPDTLGGDITSPQSLNRYAYALNNPETLTDPLGIKTMWGTDLTALNDALRALEAFDPRRNQVVELRFFGGLSVKETAEILRVSPKTVRQDWKLTKAWLLRELAGSEHDAA